MAYSSWAAPGLNNVGSYQVSGRPWAYTGNLTNPGPDVISFPDVTRWVTVQNNDASINILLAFSAAGLAGTEHFVLGAGTRISLEVKISQLHLQAASGTPNVSVVAGLTNIRPESCSGVDGPSWSGSAGVG
jgi:hypothetical protein